MTDKANLEAAYYAAQQTTEAPEPSTAEKLARNLIGSAQVADDAMGNLHAKLEAMLEAAHAIIQYLVAENVELKGRLEGLEK